MGQLDKDYETLQIRALVGATSQVLRNLEVARQKLGIVMELTSAYKSLLDCGHAEAAVQSFQQIFAGSTGLSDFLLREVRLPAIMIIDLAAVEATLLLDAGDFSQIHTLLDHSVCDKLVDVGGDPLEMQTYVYDRIVQKVLRSTAIRDEPLLARQALLDLLGPLVGVTQCGGDDDEDPVDGEDGDNADPFIDMLVNAAGKEDTDTPAQKLPTDLVLPGLKPIFTRVLHIAAPGSFDVSCVEDTLAYLRNLPEDAPVLLRNFLNPAASHVLFTAARLELEDMKRTAKELEEAEQSLDEALGTDGMGGPRWDKLWPCGQAVGVGSTVLCCVTCRCWQAASKLLALRAFSFASRARFDHGPGPCRQALSNSCPFKSLAQPGPQRRCQAVERQPPHRRCLTGGSAASAGGQGGGRREGGHGRRGGGRGPGP